MKYNKRKLNHDNDLYYINNMNTEFCDIDDYNNNFNNKIFEDKTNYNSLKTEPFELETTSVWDFPNRGSWATHNGNYRGNWSPYIPKNLILRYTNVHDTVLDQFIGSGTTMIEAKLLNRKGIGIDINPDAINLTKKNINFELKDSLAPDIYLGDARNIGFLGNESIDFICTHPPYANIIKYSKNITGDLSILTINEFINEMQKVADECMRILKNNKFCAIMMGDMRLKGHIVPLGFKIMNIFLNKGFMLKEIIIKKQHNCKSTPFWKDKSLQYNFLLIAHEYIFVFHKNKIK